MKDFLTFKKFLEQDKGDGKGGAAGDQTDDKTNKTDDTSTPEFEEYNGFKVPKGTVEAINKRVASEKHGLKTKFDSLQTQYNELQTQLEELKLKSMTDAERQAHDEKKRKEFESQLTQKAEMSETKFKKYFLDTELFKEVGNYDVHNAKQVVKLLKDEYKHEFSNEDSTDELSVVFNINGASATVEEAVKKFLSAPENANLLKSTFKPGGGTLKKNNQTEVQKTEFTRTELKNPAIRAVYSQALKQKLDVKIIDK